MEDKVAILQQRLKELFSRFLGQPVVVAYSGGKDSTFLLHNVLVLLEKMRSNPLVVVYADTLVENPLIHQHAMEFLEKVKAYCEDAGIDARILIAQPEVRNTFWVNVIGKGYPMPNHWFRWCQNKLKIQPMKKILEGFSEGILLVAVRTQESVARKKSLSRRLNGMELEKNHLRVFAPIFDFTEEDIWEFLTQNRSPWGEDYSKVINLYKAARGECPLIPEESSGKNGCGSRFGCWVCTVVKEDKTLKNQAQGSEVLKRLYEFRNWMAEFSLDPQNRLPFRRNGKPAINKKGMLSFQARKEILKRLQELEKQTKMQIISTEEIEEIKRIWEEDKRRFSKLLPPP
ncbi:phosphoadenosine phosphosulfate reductase family protein [Thermocrinis sp.]|jgi:DNA sulfur modification protein DndC|uniref:phosphoadenosine phosphosulfate reductase domain-containing protein n=1 Tax=Thermocrinis sp. TaxID=2024383 RepID=UPI003C00154B